MVKYLLRLIPAHVLLAGLLLPAAHAEPTPKPSISLLDAHAKALDSLKPQGAGQFYCLQVSSGETSTKAGTILVWRLEFADDAGIRFSLTLPREGPGDVTVVSKRMAPQLHPGVKSLTELESVIANFKHLPKGAEVTQGDGIVVKHKTRTYFVHEREPSGEYSINAREVVGPAGDGFVMRIREVKRGESRRKSILPLQRFYWSNSRRFFPGFTPEMELLVEIDYATAFSAVPMFAAVGMNGCEYPAPVRPSLTLAEVGELALATLSADEREQYYLSRISARQIAASGQGEWQVHLSNASGSRILLELDGAGKVTHSLRETSMPGTADKITSLADAERILTVLLKGLDEEAAMTREGNKLTLEIEPRVFHIHPEIEPGVFAKETEARRGPSRRGFLMVLEEAELAGALETQLKTSRSLLPGTLSSDTGRYFAQTKFACKTNDPQRVLIVEMMGGDDTNVYETLYRCFERWKP